MLGLDLPVGFLVLPGFFQRLDLLFGEDQLLLDHAGFQCLEPFAEGLQLMPHPHPADPRRRNGQPCRTQLVGHPLLPQRRFLNGHPKHCRFNGSIHPVFQAGLLPAQILQRQLTPLVIQLLEPVKAVSRVAPQLAGFRHVAQPFGQFQKPQLVLGDLLRACHLTSLLSISQR